jgi:hypothetical protein
VRRFVVRPCDNLGSLPDAPRDRTWIVFDRLLQTEVQDCETRTKAKAAAADWERDS